MSEPAPTCDNCRFMTKTNKYRRHFTHQCNLDGGVHKKDFSCKRHKEA